MAGESAMGICLMINKTLSVKPLPCPFCGKEPKVTWSSVFTIKCVTHDCMNPKTDSWQRELAFLAVEQWNTRWSAW